MCQVVAGSGDELTQADEVLWQCEDHVLVASLGALAVGHVMLVSRRHVLSSAGLGSLESLSLKESLWTTKRVLRERFGKVVVFEHGPSAPGQSVGCTVDHAHVHLVPFGGDFEHLVRRADPDFTWQPVSSILAARCAADSGLPYLYFETDSGAAWLAVSEHIPSQFFRRVVCGAESPERYDWRRDSRLSTVRDTVASLHDAFDSGNLTCQTTRTPLRKTA